MSAHYLGAMPALYGAPRYSPPRRFAVVDRPFDPDDLPIEAQRATADLDLSGMDPDLVGEPVMDDGTLDAELVLERAAEPFGPPAEVLRAEAS